MVGIIIKFDEWSNNIIKDIFSCFDYSSWFFKIKYWESYGDTLEGNVLEITSAIIKNEVINSNNNFYPEFVEMFVRDEKDKDSEITYYKEFTDSPYFLSLSIIDHRNIEICCKREDILIKIQQNIANKNLKNLRLNVLEEINPNSNISIWRGKENAIY